MEEVPRDRLGGEATLQLMFCFFMSFRVWGENREKWDVTVCYLDRIDIVFTALDSQHTSEKLLSK